jgi:PleD family two-component response regulator
VFLIHTIPSQAKQGSLWDNSITETKKEQIMPQTILIVDDEKRLVSLVESYLTQEGYRVATAFNGREALAIAEKENPDLVILDIMMP